MSYTILCEYNFPSPCAKLPFSWVQVQVSKAGQTVLEFSSGQQLYLDSQMYYTIAILVKFTIEFLYLQEHLSISRNTSISTVINNDCLRICAVYAGRCLLTFLSLGHFDK